MPEYCIGIDLGTTHSCVGVWKDDHVEIIPNDCGKRTTSSVVYINGNNGNGNEIIVGDLAKNKCKSYPKNTIYDIKRLMGIKITDTSISNDIENYSFKVTHDKNDNPLIEIDNHKYRPEEISAMILGKLKKDAENYLGVSVTNAVITCPAYFNDAQRTATKNSAKIAGLNCLRVINEPTAACLCYGIKDKNKGKTENVMIYDLGGGTLDVSVLEVDNGIFEVKGVSGNTRLGGEDFTQVIVDYIIQKTQFTEDKCTPTIYEKQIQKIREIAENAKISLSQLNSVDIDVELLGDEYHFKLTRNMFETLCKDLFDKCMTPIIQVLNDINMDKSEIDELVLVGGSTRVPKIQSLLSNLFMGKNLNKSINPDEAVAYGATIQSAILSNSDTSETTKDIVLLDVIPLSLGIATNGGIMSIIIPRNTSTPCEKSNMYTNVEDNQRNVLIQIYEGERQFTKDNHLLGKFELTQLPRAIRGTLKIEVTFSIDANGILNVSALEKSNQISKNIVIERDDSTKLSSEEIQEMIENSVKYKAEDEVKRNIFETKLAFEKYLYKTQSELNNNEFASALKLDELSEANNLILQTLEWLKETDLNTGEEIERSMDEIMNCKKNVEYMLQPSINKIYSLQMATIAKKSKIDISDKNTNDQQISNEQINDMVKCAFSKSNQTQSLPNKIKLKFKSK